MSIFDKKNPVVDAVTLNKGLAEALKVIAMQTKHLSGKTVWTNQVNHDLTKLNVLMGVQKAIEEYQKHPELNLLMDAVKLHCATLDALPKGKQTFGSGGKTREIISNVMKLVEKHVEEQKIEINPIVQLASKSLDSKP